MQRFELDAEAGQVSAELARLGVAAGSRVHVLVEVGVPADLPMAAISQAGGAFGRLVDEPGLYSDADLLRRLNTSLVIGQLGTASGGWLLAHGTDFHGDFGLVVVPTAPNAL